MMMSETDFVMEFVFKVSLGDPKQGRYEKRNEDMIEWAMTGPWLACPRCGKELVPRLIDTPCLGVLWQTSTAHVAPCGQRCLPGLDSWIGDCGPPHVSNETCSACKSKRESQ